MSRPILLLVALAAISVASAAQRRPEQYILFGLLDGRTVACDYKAGRGGVLRGVTLDDSMWAPARLLRRGPPEYVRLQVPDSDARPRYRVKLFRIDYDSWRVTTLLESRQIVGLGAGSEHVYLRTDQGLRLLDRRSHEITKPATPFEKLHEVGRHWIVRLDGATVGHVALFDPEAGRVVREFQLPGAFHPRHHPPSTGPIFRVGAGERFLACVPPVSVLGSHRFADSHVWLLDLETGKRRSYPFRAPLTRGSGIPGWLTRFDIWFSGPQELRFFTTRGESELQLVTVDTTTKQPSEAPASEAALTARRTRDRSFYVPPYLEESDIESRWDLLALFLQRHGIEQKIRRATDRGGFQYDGSSPVGFSADGKRFLGWLPVAAGRRGFYGDLEADTVKEVVVPDPFRPRHIFCVATRETPPRPADRRPHR